MQKIFENWRAYQKQVLNELTPGMIDHSPELHTRKTVTSKLTKQQYKMMRQLLSLIDPTGVASWPDFHNAKEKFKKNPSISNTADLIATAISTLPLVTLAAAPAKAAKAISVASELKKSEKIFNTVEGGAQLTQKINKAADALPDILKINDKIIKKLAGNAKGFCMSPKAGLAEARKIIAENQNCVRWVIDDFGRIIDPHVNPSAYGLSKGQHYEIVSGGIQIFGTPMQKTAKATSTTAKAENVALKSARVIDGLAGEQGYVIVDVPGQGRWGFYASSGTGEMGHNTWTPIANFNGFMSKYPKDSLGVAKYGVWHPGNGHMGKLSGQQADAMTYVSQRDGMRKTGKYFKPNSPGGRISQELNDLAGFRGGQLDTAALDRASDNVIAQVMPKGVAPFKTKANFLANLILEKLGDNIASAVGVSTNSSMRDLAKIVNTGFNKLGKPGVSIQYLKDCAVNVNLKMNKALKYPQNKSVTASQNPHLAGIDGHTGGGPTMSDILEAIEAAAR